MEEIQKLRKDTILEKFEIGEFNDIEKKSSERINN